MSEKSRLRWLCRRGMKELDVVMTGYLDNYYSNASELEKNDFKALLEMPDPELYALIMGRVTSPSQTINELTRTIRGMISQSRLITK